ncbi:MAG: DUF6783 domain-containing protein [Ruminococcus sp.]
MHAALCGRSRPNSVAVARYGASAGYIQTKSLARHLTQIAFFITLVRIKRKISFTVIGQAVKQGESMSAGPRK